MSMSLSLSPSPSGLPELIAPRCAADVSLEMEMRTAGEDDWSEVQAEVGEDEQNIYLYT